MTIDSCFAELLSDPRNHARPPPPEIPLATVRTAADARMALAPKRDVHSVQAVSIDPVGRQIRCRLYHPTDADDLPVIVFFHGGGWVWGSLDSHDSVCRSLALDAGCALLSVDYRLAPEHPFPAALEDAHAALSWVRSNGAALGLDPARIALSGDSSGANLALHLASRAPGPLRYLGLFYPPVDPACASTSQQAYADNHLLTRAAMVWFWDCYLGGQPFDLGDLSALPPTTIALAEHDILHDEGHALADRISGLGVATRRRSYAGMIHAFISLPHITPMALTALADMGADIRAAMERS